MLSDKFILFECDCRRGKKFFVCRSLYQLSAVGRNERKHLDREQKIFVPTVDTYRNKGIVAILNPRMAR